MLKFKHVHIYCNEANTLELADIVVPGVRKYFPSVTIDMRQSLLTNIDDKIAETLVSLRISNIKKPFNEQPKNIEGVSYEKNYPGHLIVNGVTHGASTTGRKYKELILYDGFKMQRLLETLINKNESNTDHLHIVFEDRLICTFDEEYWRYHARTLVCGVPSIISTTGMVEAPAKPKEWYIRQLELAAYSLDPEDENNEVSVEKFAVNKYLDYGDYRINFIAVGYVLQALFFFLTEGNPFCNDSNCRLYNAHWQEELIHSQIETEKICNEHDSILHEFNTVCS
jgi:putative metallopeptidase DUF6775